MLKEGQTVHAEVAGATARVGRLLGEGTQGAVYLAEVRSTTLALKWYKPEYLPFDPGLRTRIARLIRIGAPNPQFLWPLALTIAPGTSGFGYLMPLREPRFVGMDAVMAGRSNEQPVHPTFRTLATVGLGLASTFLDLHARGLCYRDINFGNIFLDPATGDICVCDNDNVDTTGVPGAIGGTPFFMAPEIVRGEALPTTQTDLFSLSVLLFRLLLKDHPLTGARELAFRILDSEAMQDLFGRHPLFVFDPNDHSNAPDPVVHRTCLHYWPLLPAFVRQAFTRAFTTGLHVPQARPLENEWRRTFSRLRDLIVYCSCGAEAFFDSDATAAAPDWAPYCWHCGSLVKVPPRLAFDPGGADGSTVVMLNCGSMLYPHHINAQRYDYSAPVAQVVQHPTKPEIWGLRNLTGATWTVTPPGRAPSEVPPGRSAVLAAGSRINFGRRRAEIRA